MGHSHYDDANRERAAWNAGKKVGTKRPLTQKQIWAVRFFLDCERRIRDRALFDLAIDSKLRGRDLVKISIRTHSFRRTKASMIYKATGNLRAIQILLGIPRSRTPFDTWRRCRGCTALSRTN